MLGFVDLFLKEQIKVNRTDFNGMDPHLAVHKSLADEFIIVICVIHQMRL